MYAVVICTTMYIIYLSIKKLQGSNKFSREEGGGGGGGEVKETLFSICIKKRRV